MNFFCPVCGFDGLNEPPYSPSGEGLYEVCPCCGFQFGVTDDNQGISFHEWREAWIDRGMLWTSPGRTAPKGWDPLAQLRDLAKRTSNVMNGPLLGSE